VHIKPPVLDPAVSVDVEGLDGELAAAGLVLVLRLALIVGQQPRLQHEVTHVDEGAADLAAPVADHPPLVHHPRGRRHILLLLFRSLPLLLSCTSQHQEAIDLILQPLSQPMLPLMKASSQGTSGGLLVDSSFPRPRSSEAGRGHGRDATRPHDDRLSTSMRGCWVGLGRVTPVDCRGLLS
jgi:hypothetical protein